MRVAGTHERLGRRILSQYVASHDPTAPADEAGLRRAQPAHAAITVLLEDVAREVAALGEQIEILSKEPGSARAFRVGVRSLAGWLGRNPARVPAFSHAVALADRRCRLTYHLGDLVETAAGSGGVSVDQLARLTSPGLNPDKEQAELAVIVPVDFPEGQQQRLRNCLAVLHALNRQSLGRSRYRVVVVEQGLYPRAVAKVAELADDYVFAPKPGDFNKGWLLNIAVKVVDGATHLCLLDPDVLPDKHFLAGGLRLVRAGASALLPFSEVLHLDETHTAVALRQVLPLSSRGGTGLVDDRWLRGFAMIGAVGYGVWVSRERYWAVGGHDERSRGPSDGDTEFHGRLTTSGGVRRLPGRLLHLWHPRPFRHPP